MGYAVKEMYYTLQGEGAHAGRAAVFLRFAGCNLWTGREKDREYAVCKFCDTQFVGTDGENGGKFKKPTQLAYRVKEIWIHGSLTGLAAYGKARPYVVCTGGEPLLQLDRELVRALKWEGFQVAVETNGTIESPGNLDWICVSPKANAEIKQRWGNELKLVYPQTEHKPSDFDGLMFEHFFLQPKEEHGKTEENTQACVEYCLKHPWWRLSLQTHKIVNIK